MRGALQRVPAGGGGGRAQQPPALPARPRAPLPIPHCLVAATTIWKPRRARSAVMVSDCSCSFELGCARSAPVRVVCGAVDTESASGVEEHVPAARSIEASQCAACFAQRFACRPRRCLAVVQATPLIARAPRSLPGCEQALARASTCSPSRGQEIMASELSRFIEVREGRPALIPAAGSARERVADIHAADERTS